jgi:SET domain-containing protein 6
MLVFCLSMMANTFDANSIPEAKGTAELKQAVLDVLSKRIAEYETTIEDDERLLDSTVDVRRRMAIEVRIGEKRILKKARERVGARRH